MARIEGIKKSLVKKGAGDKTVKEITGGGNLVNAIP